MSLEHALDIYNDYVKEKQTKVFDIAYEYVGMGHIRVLSCDLTTHKLFYHISGGANGWAREENYQDIIKKNPSDELQYYFSEWFMYINTKSE